MDVNEQKRSESEEQGKKEAHYQDDNGLKRTLTKVSELSLWYYINNIKGLHL